MYLAMVVTMQIIMKSKEVQFWRGSTRKVSVMLQALYNITQSKVGIIY